jgi:hypothetical protein
MTKYALFALVAILIPLKLVAQERHPVLKTMEQIRGEYPSDWSHEDRGKFLNRTAWIHKADGWGMLRKPGGNNCPTPQGVAISCDYLVFGPTMQGYDVLGDETVPQFNLGDNFANDPGRFLLPVDPNPGTPVPNPGTPIPPPAESLLQQTLNEFRQEFHNEALLQHQERVEAREFRENVKSEWKKFGAFVAKYILPSVGALLLGAELAKDDQ